MTTCTKPVCSAQPTTAPKAGARNEPRLSLSLRLYDGYAQITDFEMPGVPLLAIDEPPPLGAGRGPDPVHVLGAALGSCLGASLLFCLRKAHVEVHDLRTMVEGIFSRDAAGRLRIGSIRVKLSPQTDPADLDRLQRCVEVFEDYCVVTESVRHGIDVSVDVAPVARSTPSVARNST